MYSFVKPLRLGWIAHIFHKYRREIEKFRRKSNIKNYSTASPTRNIRQKYADFLIGVFKEETILNVRQSISKVRKNWSHSVGGNVCRYGKWREQWNVREGTKRNADLGLIVQVCGVISDRNGCPET